ncbi:MAG TPA: hypothetical protein PLV93_08700 [Microthrixaceae bacterium]|nr:hypothetical protein [Microthrixaceae bacterium]HNI35466.1 hypothetical protein [Microthrixaceae bacterium]
MSANQVPNRHDGLRQGLLLAVAVVALVIAWRERSFARNRAKFGAVRPPDPRP